MKQWILGLKVGQDRQCTHKRTLWHIRIYLRIPSSSEWMDFYEVLYLGLLAIINLVISVQKI